MLIKQCNIDKTDRINRAIIGAILFFAALIGMSPLFTMKIPSLTCLLINRNPLT